MHIKTSISKDRVYYSLLCLYINILPIMDIVADVCILMGKTFVYKSQIQNALCGILIIVLLICLNWTIADTKLMKLGAGLCICLALFLVSCACTPEIKPMIVHTYLTFVVLIIFTVFFICQIKDMGMFLNKLEKYYLLIVIYSIVVMLVKNELPHGYSMNYSYNTFFISGIALMLGIRLRKPTRILLFMVVFITNVIAGARGALLCDFILFLFALTIIIKNTDDLRKIVRIVVMTVSAMIVYLLIPNIARYLYEKYPSRTLSLLAKGNIAVLSGREIYYDSIIETIIRDPLKFRGVLADRILMAKIDGIPVNSSNLTTYAHNFFLEFLFQFGLFLGIPLLCILLFEMLKNLIWIIKNNNYDIYLSAYFLVAFAYAVGQLMFSGSYLICSSTGYLIAGLVLCRRAKRTMIIDVKSLVDFLET
ncbi:MAG: O-antigen ligase family protein [Butyrivibrio sp.]|nr:O-antigen ligase family protein [Butyrivibrio sp.]